KILRMLKLLTQSELGDGTTENGARVTSFRGSTAVPLRRDVRVTARGPKRFRYTNLTFFSGRLRTGLPVAAKIALSTAGVTTLIVGSPTPPQKSPDGTITVSTLGISARRRIGYRSKFISPMRPFCTVHSPYIAALRP